MNRVASYVPTPISTRVFPPLAKGGLGGVVPAKPAPRSRFGAAGPVDLPLMRASIEGAAFALSTPPNPPFARGGKGPLAGTIV
jgi:hypothetical protein